MPVYHQRWFSGPTPAPPPQPESLRAMGPIVAVQLEVPNLLAKYLADHGGSVPTPVTGWALIDTGATTTAVNEKTVTGLGVAPVAAIKVGTAGGYHDQPVFPLKVVLPQVPITFEYEQVTGANLDGQTIAGRPILLLIGRDILRRMIFIYDGVNGQFTLGF